MTPELEPVEALARAQQAARLWQVRLRIYARDRAKERNTRAPDIRNAILTAAQAIWCPNEGTWRLEGGTDIDGDGLTVVVAIDGYEVRLVTQF